VVEKTPKEAIAIARATTSRLVWSPEERADLEALAQSRTAAVLRVERARILLADAKTPSCSQVARTLPLSRTKVTRCVRKASRLGVQPATTSRGQGGHGAFPPPRGLGFSTWPATNRKPRGGRRRARPGQRRSRSGLLEADTPHAPRRCARRANRPLAYQD
jgi:hypothetical protein